VLRERPWQAAGSAGHAPSHGRARVHAPRHLAALRLPAHGHPILIAWVSPKSRQKHIAAAVSQLATPLFRVAAATLLCGCRGSSPGPPPAPSSLPPNCLHVLSTAPPPAACQAAPPSVVDRSSGIPRLGAAATRRGPAGSRFRAGRRPPRVRGRRTRLPPESSGEDWPESGRRRGPVRPGTQLQRFDSFQGSPCKFPGPGYKSSFRVTAATSENH
jgi:hypothetical protein